MSRISSKRLAVIREELEAIAKSGVLTPDEVVAAARNPNSAMHDQFNWDDQEAAHAHRLQQARQLIRSVTVEVTRSDLKVVQVPMFTQAPARSSEGYYKTQAIVRTQLNRQELIILRLETIGTMLHNLACPEVDDLLAEVNKLKNRLMREL
jgi:hypothetical protein